MECIQRTALLSVALSALGLVVGCGGGSPATSAANKGPGAGGPAPMAQAEFDAESGPHVAGKKALVAGGCFKCHSVNGARAGGGGGPMAGGPPGDDGPPGGRGGPMGGGGRPGGRGPDLGNVAKDPTHTVEWIVKFVNNPKSVKPESRMPPFEGKIKEADIKAIAEYLASLK